MDNPRIIHAPINRRRYAETSPITQYDYGYLLLPEGVELPTTYEIDFSNDKEKGTSLPVYGGAEGAEVPEELIRTGKDIYAFYYRVGDGYGKTEHTWRIPNHCRPSRDGETPTPSQQSSIDQLIVRSNEAVESAEASASEASESAQEAAESARASGESALSASNSALSSGEYASNALGYAESASASASASAQSASDAETARQAATSLVAEAQRYANASEQSAQASATSASQAQGFAQSASASAQSASGYASNAQSSAQTASAKAQDASTSAQTASQKATESAQSASQALSYKTDAESAKTASQTAQGLAESARDTAVQAKTDAESARDEAQNLVDGISGKVEQIDANTASIASLEEDRYKPYVTDSASGAIASFPDGADGIPLKSLVIDINPVQDLHGYDHPWVGGGVNKWDEQWELGRFDTTTGDNIENTIQIRAKNLTPVIPSTTYYISSPENVWFLFYDANKNVISEGLPESASSGNARSFGGTASTRLRMTTPADCYYIRFYCQTSYGTTYNNDIAINYPDTITTYSPYENICPISGWNSVELVRTGFNQWDEQWELGYYSNSNGSKQNSNKCIRAKNPIPVLPNTAYYIKCSKKCSLRFYDSNNVFISGSGWGTYTITTFTTPQNCYYMTFYMEDAYGTTYNHDISINYPSTDHSYHPYTGRSITISLGQTVYGGHLDVLSGVLTVDRAMVTLDGSADEAWSIGGSGTHYQGYTYALTDIKPLTGYTTVTDVICDRLKSGTWNNAFAGVLEFGQTDKATGFGLDSLGITSTPNLNSWLAENPLTVVYPLATPLTIQLTPNQINSLLGVNNIWADSGDSTVEYRADTKKFIERLTAPDSADMIADANITSGKYFMVGNSLYKATANIANGASIIVGTNCTRKSLSEALNEINA